MRQVLRFCLEVHGLYFDPGSMNFPVADALEFGEFLFRRFEGPFDIGCGANKYRALTTAEKPIVSWNFIHETDAVAWHLSPSHSCSDIIIAPGSAEVDDLDQFRRTQRQPFAAHLPRVRFDEPAGDAKQCRFAPSGRERREFPLQLV